MDEPVSPSKRFNESRFTVLKDAITNKINKRKILKEQEKETGVSKYFY